MNVLIGCERSGIVRDAFAALGHNAWSCDLHGTNRPGNHMQGDVLFALDGENNGFYFRNLRQHTRWDLAIFHPPCTHLCVSGALWFKTKQVEQRKSIWFFMELAKAKIPRICIENPVGIMSTLWRKPDQYVQPYQFGDDASKKTGLWLIGLPKLRIDPAQRVPGRKVEWPKGSGKIVERWSNQTDSGQNRLGPSERRAEERAQTYPGIAKAMAEQWSAYLQESAKGQSHGQ